MLEELIRDLNQETQDLVAVLETLGSSDWQRPTPSLPWSIEDQLVHLAFFDEVAEVAIRDTSEFSRLLSQFIDQPGSLDELIETKRAGRRFSSVMEWFLAARSQLTATCRAADPKVRYGWFGPPMSLASMLTARLMETWAHGIDIRDSLGLAPNDSGRLAHICFLGYRTRDFSFINRGMDPPQSEVFVDLTNGKGSISYGNPIATDRISGSSLDFALVVTQRRSLLDTGLVVEGEDARKWMSIAQAFAGPPGPGRQPRLEG